CAERVPPALSQPGSCVLAPLAGSGKAIDGAATPGGGPGVKVVEMRSGRGVGWFVSRASLKNLRVATSMKFVVPSSVLASPMIRGCTTVDVADKSRRAVQSEGAAGRQLARAMKATS